MKKLDLYKDEIKFLMRFYFQTAWQKSGGRWTSEHSGEIDDMIDKIDKLISLRVREILRGIGDKRRRLNHAD